MVERCEALVKVNRSFSGDRGALMHTDRKRERNREKGLLEISQGTG